jgi:hypothetical protein
VLVERSLLPQLMVNLSKLVLRNNARLLRC